MISSPAMSLCLLYIVFVNFRKKDCSKLLLRRFFCLVSFIFILTLELISYRITYVNYYFFIYKERRQNEY